MLDGGLGSFSWSSCSKRFFFSPEISNSITFFSITFHIKNIIIYTDDIKIQDIH